MVARPGFRDGLREARLQAVSQPPREPVLAKLGRAIGRAINLADRGRTAVLSLAGFGCMTSAAWVTWGRGAGLAATGASLLVLELLTRGDGGR